MSKPVGRIVMVATWSPTNGRERKEEGEGAKASSKNAFAREPSRCEAARQHWSLRSTQRSPAQSEPQSTKIETGI